MSVDPSTLRARCGRCGFELWDVRAGEPTLANRILKLRADGTIAARCPAQGCGADVPIPFLQIATPVPTPQEPADHAVRPIRRRLGIRQHVPSGG